MRAPVPNSNPNMTSPATGLSRRTVCLTCRLFSGIQILISLWSRASATQNNMATAAAATPGGGD